MRAKFIETRNGELAVAVEPETDEERMLLRQFIIHNHPSRGLAVLSQGSRSGAPGNDGCMVGWRDEGITLPQVAEAARRFVAGEGEYSELASAVGKLPRKAVEQARERAAEVLT